MIMRLSCAIFILGLLQITMFAMSKCNASSGFMRHQAIKREDVPRVRVKVFRGPTEEGDGELFATWGYWIQQPSR